MKITANHNSLIVIIAFILLVNCTEKSKKLISNNKYLYGINYIFSADSINFRSHLLFNKDNSFQQNYIFDSIGNLIEKRGFNFFGEEEVYTFDENNSIVEFKKIVKFDKTKFGLQEFIKYQNGIIIKNNSHYFDFKIVDSSKTDFKIEIYYLGAFKIKKMSVVMNNFPSKTSDVNVKQVIHSGSSDSISFWAKKNTVYDSNINFYQVNLYLEYESDRGLLKSIDDKGPLKEQIIILRKLKK